MVLLYYFYFTIYFWMVSKPLFYRQFFGHPPVKTAIKPGREYSTTLGSCTARKSVSWNYKYQCSAKSKKFERQLDTIISSSINHHQQCPQAGHHYPISCHGIHPCLCLCLYLANYRAPVDPYQGWAQGPNELYTISSEVASPGLSCGRWPQKVGQTLLSLLYPTSHNRQHSARESIWHPWLTRVSSTGWEPTALLIFPVSHQQHRWLVTPFLKT